MSHAPADRCVVRGGVYIKLLAHMPAQKDRSQANSWIKGLVLEPARESLCKTVPLDDGRRLRQDFENLTESQIKTCIVDPLANVGIVTRIPERDFQKRLAMESDEKSSKKARASSMQSSFGAMVNLLANLSEIQGGSEEEQVRFRHDAVSTMASVTRISAHGLREATDGKDA